MIARPLLWFCCGVVYALAIGCTTPAPLTNETSPAATPHEENRLVLASNPADTAPLSDITEFLTAHDALHVGLTSFRGMTFIEVAVHNPLETLIEDMKIVIIDNPPTRSLRPGSDLRRITLYLDPASLAPDNSGKARFTYWGMLEDPQVRIMGRLN